MEGITSAGNTSMSSSTVILLARKAMPWQGLGRTAITLSLSLSFSSWTLIHIYMPDTS